MTQTILQECKEIVKDLVGHDYLYFETSVEVKTTPHAHPFSAWAVCVSPKDALYVMDAEEQWHEVELEDMNAGLVIGSLYQRLKLMRISYAKAS
ncbi:MAG TPA: hypothetical protein VM884_08460 [Flavisolibacter sp.]|jgi:hypothetical protein|nr:hypothetical protein [Flavisolibacter sp.]